MEKPLFASHPEPVNGKGEIVVSRTQLAMLHALLDRPDARVQSHRDWVRASYPYMPTRHWPAVRGRALRAIKSMHPRWVTTVRCGSRRVTQITDRGFAILDLRVPVHVRGFGRYYGLDWKQR
jgi:hypothetical protein